MNGIVSSMRVLLAALVAGVLAGAATARPLDQVVETHTLKVIAYEDNEPFSWTADGVAKGIDVELGKALASKLGVAAEIILRYQGENVDRDLRGQIANGPPTGGGTGDVMMHVPTDPELAQRHNQVVIGNPYFLETVALAVNPERIAPDSDFQIFKKLKIGVKLATVSDYFLMTFEDGALINNISHFTKASQGTKEFLGGETSAIMGVRSEIEGMLFGAGTKAHFISPEMTDIVRKSWTVGMAVDEHSRDLGYALGEALGKLEASGELKAIFVRYGVTYMPPPGS